MSPWSLNTIKNGVSNDVKKSLQSQDQLYLSTIISAFPDPKSSVMTAQDSLAGTAFCSMCMLTFIFFSMIVLGIYTAGDYLIIFPQPKESLTNNSHNDYPPSYDHHQQRNRSLVQSRYFPTHPFLFCQRNWL